MNLKPKVFYFAQDNHETHYTGGKKSGIKQSKLGVLKKVSQTCSGELSQHIYLQWFYVFDQYSVAYHLPGGFLPLLRRRVELMLCQVCCMCQVMDWYSSVTK